jgi:hypothetical protein
MKRRIRIRDLWPASTLLLATLSAAAPAASSGARTPGIAGQAPGGDDAEIALAVSAAPSTLTSGADVYAWHDGHFVKVRTGTTGFACMVSRDPRANGVFPMCFDPEAARTLMQEEMMTTELRSRRLSNTAIQQRIDAAYADGTLHHPEKPAITYMMSSHQMLLSYQADSIEPVGAWRPHVMIYLPHASAAQFALGAENDHGPVSAPFKDDADGMQLVIQVPHWADTP